MRPALVNLRKLTMPMALCAAALLAAPGARARDVDVRWSVTIGVPGLVVQSGPVVGVPVYGVPVYGAPVYAPPVMAMPAPVYAPAPIAVMAPPVYGPPRHRHPGHATPRAWDRDGDGIPNRYDPVYNPRWDRDGDGIPNRHDRYDDRYDNRYRDGWRR